jgi:polar amino acid transport system substrate-binding protein
MPIDPVLIREIAPTGCLRAALNMANPVLAASHTASERPAGVTIDLARELARRLSLPVEFIECPVPADAAAAVGQGRADIGFLAIDPERAKQLYFAGAYVEIEGCYLVRQASTLQSVDQVDVPGRQVVVGLDTAYELYLRRHFKRGTLVKIDAIQNVVHAMLERNVEVGAGVRQQLEGDAKRIPGLRLLPGSFMKIRQAMMMPLARSPAARALLDAFTRDVLATGFVQGALERHGIEGARVAE